MKYSSLLKSSLSAGGRRLPVIETIGIYSVIKCPFPMVVPLSVQVWSPFQVICKVYDAQNQGKPGGGGQLEQLW